MNPDDRGTLWIGLMAALAALWLAWQLVPSLQPWVAFLVALWLLVAAWLSTRGGG